MLANAMILEKCKNNDEVIDCIKRITKNIEDKKQLAELKRLIKYLYGNWNITDNFTKFVISQFSCKNI